MTNKTRPCILAKIAGQNIFFRDFLVFLKLLTKRPLELAQTGTGNLKVKEIKALGEVFKHDIYHRDKNGEIMFATRTEDDFPYLIRIRQLAQVMRLVYKRKNKLFLSQAGRGYLDGLDEKTQFEQLVLGYLHEANWAYYRPQEEIIEKLQKNQAQIWAYLRREDDWIDFSQFVEALRLIFRLPVSDKDHSLFLDHVRWSVEDVLVNILEQLELVEIRKEKMKNWGREITSFRLTVIGREILANDSGFL